MYIDKRDALHNQTSEKASLVQPKNKMKTKIQLNITGSPFAGTTAIRATVNGEEITGGILAGAFFESADGQPTAYANLLAEQFGKVIGKEVDADFLESQFGEICYELLLMTPVTSSTIEAAFSECLAATPQLAGV